MHSVDLYTGDGAGGNAEPDDAVVERRFVVAARFPPVHPLAGKDLLFREDGRRWQQEVCSGGEPFVRDGEDAAAERGGDEVWELLGSCDCILSSVMRDTQTHKMTSKDVFREWMRDIGSLPRYWGLNVESICSAGIGVIATSSRL